MSVNIDFVGKRILITGGGNGLGRALVKKFHAGNALVFTVDRDEKALASLKTECPNITSAVVDLADWDGTRKVIESFGRMDHLVNNAAILIPQTFFEITKESYEKQLSVNCMSIINVTQVVAKEMIQSKTEGTIVNMSSVGDRSVVLGMGIYCASKAAVTMLTKSMALELGEHNIRVNCVCPGALDTQMLKECVPSEASSAAADRSVIKGLIDPSDISDLISYLLSPLSRKMTGSAVTIDGGLTIM